MWMRLIRFAFDPAFDCAVPEYGATHYLETLTGQSGGRLSLDGLIRFCNHPRHNAQHGKAMPPCLRSLNNRILVKTVRFGFSVWAGSALAMALLLATPGRAQDVIAWGRNTDGQCNIMASVTNPVCIAAGGFHSLALNADGTVAAWGKNWDGQTNVPTAATNVVAIAAGGNHSLALQGDGSVLAWGRGWDGQTDVPAAATNVVAIAAGWAHSLALQADGTVVAWGNDDLGQTDVSFLALDVIAIAAGYYHNVALRSDGTVVTWGGDVPVPPDATNVVAIAAGWEHSLALRADGSVLAWGDNTYGESTVPASATNVVAIAADWYHNLPLRADGTVVAWGAGANNVTNVPAGLSNVASIAVGEDYDVAIVGAGPPQFGPQLASVVAHAGGGALLSANVQGPYPLTYQWFQGGQELTGATNRYLWLPACQLTNGGDYVLVAANPFGQATSQPVNLAVRADAMTISAVGGWGDNSSGQCSISHGASNPRAIAAGAFHALALNADGTVAAWGKNWDGQTNVPPAATNVIAIAAGGYHSLALRDDGSVLAWGRDWDGQTNVPPAATNVVAIAAGAAHSLALCPDGTVVAWGNNDFGQTNVPPQAQGVIAIAAGYYHNLALRSDHTVVAWGLQSTVPASATNIVAIAGGWWHSLALRADGSVVAWGDNSYGQCSVPASATNIVGIAAGYSHNLAWRADGTIITWGNGSWGVTNVPSGLGNVAGIAAGQDFSLAIVELGPPLFNQPLEAAVAHVGGQAILSAGVSGTCPLALQWFHDNGAIEGATNTSLLLTNVQLLDAGTYTLVATNAAGLTNSEATTLTVLSDPAVAEVLTPQNVLIGTSVCLPASVSGAEPLAFQWCLNGTDLLEGGRITGVNSGVLCLSAAAGEDSGSYTLVVSNAYGCVTGLVAQLSVSPIVAWGDDSAGQLDVPVGTTAVVAIASGGDHNLALRSDGTVIAWGDNSSGQNNVPPSASDVVALAAGDSHSLALRADGTVIAWGDNAYGQTNVPSAATGVMAIAAGGSHSLALLLSGTVVAWGSDLSGQTIVPPSATNIIAIAAGGNGSLALRDDGLVVAWGNLPAVPSSATNILSIAAGGSDALALRDDGALIPWGGNYYGQASAPPFVTNIVFMAAGGDHTVALLGGGTVAAWGANYFGQILVPAQATNVVAVSAGGAHSLALNGPPQNNQQATVGSSVLLSAGSLGGPGASYQWQFDGMDLAGATNATLSVGPVAWTNAGVYRVLVSNGLGLTIGPPIVLAVLGTPLVFDTSPDGLQITNGGIHLRLLGASDLGPVVIYASSDLLAWQPIFTNPPIIGPVDFTDPAITNQPWRFYRASENP